MNNTTSMSIFHIIRQLCMQLTRCASRLLVYGNNTAYTWDFSERGFAPERCPGVVLLVLTARIMSSLCVFARSSHTVMHTNTHPSEHTNEHTRIKTLTHSVTPNHTDTPAHSRTHAQTHINTYRATQIHTQAHFYRSVLCCALYRASWLFFPPFSGLLFCFCCIRVRSCNTQLHQSMLSSAILSSLSMCVYCNIGSHLMASGELLVPRQLQLWRIWRRLITVGSVVDAFVHACAWVCVRLCLCGMCVHVFECVCFCVCVHVVCICACLCSFVFVFYCMCVCAYVCVCVHVF